MSRSEREKGARGERECVELLTAHGLDAERTFYQPGSKKADVDSLAGRFEVKLLSRFVAYKWLHDDVRGIYVRADRKPALIILRAEDAAKLFQTDVFRFGGRGPRRNRQDIEAPVIGEDVQPNVGEE